MSNYEKRVCETPGDRLCHKVGHHQLRVNEQKTHSFHSGNGNLDTI